MGTTFSEANYEEAVLELFRNMGYQYAYGPNVERDFQSPLYDEVLLEYIYRLNPALPAEAINEAVYKLKNYENGELVQKNETLKTLLEMITIEMKEAFKAAGYDEELARVTLSNRPDLCEYQCRRRRSRMAGVTSR